VQIPAQKPRQDIFAKPLRGVLIEVQSAQSASICKVLTVVPGPGDEEVQVVGLVVPL